MKRISALSGIALLLVSAFVVGLLLQGQQSRYSAHKWHEGEAEDVIFDVMENHVYPGVSLSEAERLLGSGCELTKEKSAALLTSLGIQEEDGIGIFLYQIREDGNRRLFFLVIHDEKNVIKTALVDSLD